MDDMLFKEHYPDAELQIEQTIPYHVVPGVASPRAFVDTVTEKFGPH